MDLKTAVDRTEEGKARDGLTALVAFPDACLLTANPPIACYPCLVLSLSIPLKYLRLPWGGPAGLFHRRLQFPVRQHIVA